MALHQFKEMRQQQESHIPLSDFPADLLADARKVWHGQVQYEFSGQDYFHYYSYKGTPLEMRVMTDLDGMVYVYLYKCQHVAGFIERTNHYHSMLSVTADQLSTRGNKLIRLLVIVMVLLVLIAVGLIIA
jgi:hypothetical protein|tara:strand:+ start:2618 stop:3007 length:390 start_codon:yes stop_codon:yes gene_type:complete